MTGNSIRKSIVAGVDGSALALRAARWAADEAARRRLPLRLVQIIDVVSATGGFAPPPSFFTALESEGRRQLAEAEAVVRQDHPELDIDLILRTASLVPALITLSEDAHLVVLGARGSGGFSGLLAGSTAIALVAHGHSPVAVIRGGEADEATPSEGPVVVGVDGSPTSEPALAVAFEEAAMRRTGLVAVHAWVEFTSDTAYATARQFLVDWEAVETREREMLAERLAGWQEKYPDVEVRRVVTGGRPAARLLDAARDGQLLVVGSRGRGGFAGMLLGSTSQALIHHAPCPVMVIRPAAAG